MEKIKVTKEDNFVWRVLTREEAIVCWYAGCFELYILYDDDSEGLIEDKARFDEAMEMGWDIGIEVGFLPPRFDAAKITDDE